MLRSCVVGVALTTYEVMDERARMLGVLLDVFEEVGATGCLVGGIAVGYHARVRATVDVDFLVSKRHVESIAKTLERLGYVVARHKDMIRVYPPGCDPQEAEAIAHLVESEANSTLRAAAKANELATVLGHEVRIVQRGALVALKFHAAVPLRGGRRIDTWT